AKRIFVAERFKCLAPPTRPFEQRGTHRFGRAAIDVVNNRFDRLADPRRWILLLQTMPCDEAFRNWVFDWRGEVHEVDAEVTGSRVLHAWPVAGRRKLNERMALPNRDRLRHGHNLSDEGSRRFAGECQRRFNFRVLREVLCVRKIESAASRVESIGALLSSLQ